MNNLTTVKLNRVYLNKPYAPFTCDCCGELVVYLRTYKSKKVLVLWDSLTPEEQRFISQAGAVEYLKYNHKVHFCIG